MSEPTPAQKLLKTHLAELGIATTYEFRFCMERRFVFDLYSAFYRLGFECDGGQWSGGHMRGRKLEDQYEKDRLAQVKGYRILRFTNREILNGYARAWVAEHLLGYPDRVNIEGYRASRPKARARVRVPYRAAK